LAPEDFKEFKQRHRTAWFA